MYLRMVLRSRPVRSAIAEIVRPCLYRSRITINSLSLITPAPRAVALQRIMGQARNPPRSRHSEQRPEPRTGGNSNEHSGEYYSGGDTARPSSQNPLNLCADISV